MRLTNVTLFGFKSFADRTDLKVLPGITGVVGPNGCGKSNIADALRWALGEQSPKALRGHRMEDVIFHGSASRRPLGFAEALLTFSNDGDLPVPWSEIAVGRRLYRDGESEYLLNKTGCRLKDIHDLFLGTGVNPKAYALMEQERLAQILTARPLDRRLFIEEAAGITRYKQQRAETVAKLDAARQNLLRVRDVIDEVRRQLGSLERQAKKAQQYKALQAERRTLELALTAAEHARLVNDESLLGERGVEEDRRAESLRARVAAVAAEQELARAELMAAEYRASDLRHALGRAELELEGSAQRAQQLVQIEAELGGETERLGAETQALEARIQTLAEERAAREQLVVTLSAEFDALRDQAAGHEAALEQIRGRLRQAREAAEGLRRHQVVLAGRRTESERAVGTLQERAEQIARRLGRVQTEQEQSAAERRELERAGEAAAARVAELTARSGELGARHGALLARSEALGRARQEAVECAEAARVELAARRSGLAALEELEAQRAGYGSGVQAVFAAAREGWLSGVIGSVTDVLEVPRELERVVEAALGDRLQWVVVDTLDTAKAALAYLGSHGGGQATFVPLDWLNGAPRAHVGADPGIVGVADVLVGCGYPALSRNLLGSTVVVRDLASAERLWSANGTDTSFVTVDGEILLPPGAMGGGRSSGGADASLLARKRAIRDLRIRVAESETALAGAIGAVQRFDAELSELTARLKETAIAREFAEADRIGAVKDLAALERELERASVFAETLDAEGGVLSREADEVGRDLSEETDRLDQDRRAAAATEADVVRILAGIEVEAEAESGRAQSFLEAQVELAALAGRIQAARSDGQRLAADVVETTERIASGRERAAALAARRAASAAERAQIEERVRALGRERDVAQQAARDAGERVAGVTERVQAVTEEGRRLEGELARTIREIQELAVRLTEVRVHRQDLEADARRQFEVAVADLQEAHQPDRDPGELEMRREAVVARIAALEPVNLVADEEYRELDERLSFLRAQHDDLTGSMKDLERALRGMTRTAQERFVEAFEAINKNFQELFTRLFEGGRAELRLIEAPADGDPLDSGVEMVAQPRGKRLQAISLLSGGEKALTGLALLFAIFYYRPSPFCLLDEVDAPLDDANISRFTRVLRELAAQTQFIVITHNRKTMEAADVLYGVTMEEPGLSRVVSVNLT